MKAPRGRNTGSEDVVISVGADGRVYFHDLDRELILVALAINPDDASMRKRLALCEAWCSRNGSVDPGGEPSAPAVP